MKIAIIGASLCAPDFFRAPSWGWELEQRAQMCGARGLLVDNAARDGDGFNKCRYGVQYTGSKANWNAGCEVMTDGTPDVILISGDLVWNSTFTGADPGSNNSADAIKADLTATCASAKQVYLSVTPPASITYNGAVWTPGASFTAMDAYCKTIWPAFITINYADYAATFGTIDGVHAMPGSNMAWANDVAWGLFGMGIDLGMQTGNYAPYDGSGGSAQITANIRAKNALGLAILASNSIQGALNG